MTRRTVLGLAVAIAMPSALPVAVAAQEERSQAVVLSTDTTVFPEGLAADPRHQRLYVSSLAHRAVCVSSARQPWAKWLDGAALGLAPVVALAVDTLRDQLVAATGRVEEAGALDTALRGELLFVRLRDGHIVQRVSFGDGRVIPGDIALLPTGDVMVSDATGGAVWLWDRARNVVRRITHPLLRSPQGMVPSRDGRHVFIADWSRGLLRLTLATGAVQSLTPDAAPLSGVDGLSRDSRHTTQDVLVGVQNGVTPPRVVRVAIARDGAQVESVREIDRPVGLRGEPTIGAFLGDAYWYVASSHWPFRSATGARTMPERPLPSVELRRLPLSAF
jgi:hypothetical protein